jgi:tetratricopeptide (TPR) repeat protein/transcriptional regulator with XRE-family HTH domain
LDEHAGPDPRRVHDLDGLARELGLLRARAARGHNRARVSLDELARRVGQPRSTVHAYVTGKHLVPADVLDRIVIALGATAAEQRGWGESWFRLAARPERSPGTVPRQLPLDVAAFTGRAAELAAMSDVGATGTGATGTGGGAGVTGIQVITGTGGVGKTALAVHWAHRNAAAFPDGHLCVDLRGYDPDQPVAPADALAGFLRALGVDPAAVPHEQAERAALYRSLLAGRRMLVLLDNVRDSEQARPLLPGAASCLVLVTSRDRLSGLVARHGGRRVDLDLLPRTDAVTLLRRLIGERAADTDATVVVAEQCARLPLALRVAAERAAADPAVELGTLAADLGNERRRLDLLDAGDDPRTAVRAVFSWSYRHLPDDAARLFRLLGLHTGRDLSTGAAAALAGVDTDTAARLLGRLVRVHLVHQSAPGRYAMHDLLRAWAAETTAATDLASERQAAWSRLLDHHLYGAATAVDLLYPAERYRRPSVAAPPVATAEFDGEASARAWLEAERANLVALAGRLDSGYATRLSAILWRHLDVCCHYADADRLHGYALAAAERAGDAAGQAVALGNLGVLHWRLGRLDGALDALGRSLLLHRQAGDPAGESRALNNLGGVYSHLGRPDEATAHFEESLRVSADHGEHIGQAVTVYNLAIMHARAGRYERAAQWCRQAMDIYSAAGDRVGVSSALAGLGNIATHLGRYREAGEYLDRAMAMVREQGNRKAQARLHGHLGTLCARTGRLDEAAEHHRRELEHHTELGDRVGQVDAVLGTAAVLLRSGRPEEAIARCEHATAVAEEIDHRYGLATAANLLGAARLGCGDAAGAVAAHRRADELATATGEHYEQARAADGLAAAYDALGDHERATTLRRRALTAYEELGVPEADGVRDALIAVPTNDWVNTVPAADRRDIRA